MRAWFRRLGLKLSGLLISPMLTYLEISRSRKYQSIEFRNNIFLYKRFNAICFLERGERPERGMKGVYSTYFRGENMSAKSSGDEDEGTRERLLPAPLLLLTPAALLYCSKQTCLACDMPMCCCCCWLR